MAEGDVLLEQKNRTALKDNKDKEAKTIAMLPLTA